MNGHLAMLVALGRLKPQGKSSKFYGLRSKKPGAKSSMLPCFAFGYAGHSRYKSYAEHVRVKIYENGRNGHDGLTWTKESLVGGKRVKI